MTRTCLISLFHPGNVLAAMTAVKWFGHLKYGKEDANLIVLIHVPGLSENNLNEIKEVIDRIIAIKGIVKSIIITDDDLKAAKSIHPWKRFSAALNKFKDIVGTGDVDEVYYAHDIVGNIAELAMNSFPHAQHISFGDALGSIYNKEFHLALASGNTIDKKNIFLKFLKKIINHSKERVVKIICGGPVHFQATKAVLILPIDQTGNCLDEMELHIVPKDFVRTLLEECASSTTDLNTYCQDLISNNNQSKYLLLLDNFSDGNFISFENEVNLYTDIINHYVPQGSFVMIKPHPLSVKPVADALCKNIESDYDTVIIKKEFSKYPIELWVNLISSCNVISFSYPSISLSYLYGKNVMYLLNPDIIERYFPEKFHASFKNADEVYRGQLNNLATWDGKGVLWSGRNV